MTYSRAQKIKRGGLFPENDAVVGSGRFVQGPSPPTASLLIFVTLSPRAPAPSPHQTARTDHHDDHQQATTATTETRTRETKSGWRRRRGLRGLRAKGRGHCAGSPPRGRRRARGGVPERPVDGAEGGVYAGGGSEAAYSLVGRYLGRGRLSQG